MNIYKCEICGNIAIKLVDVGIELVCCGQDMDALKAGVVDASVEKHVPFLEIDGENLKVRVGEDEHPMVPAHYIQFILVVQGSKVQYKTLEPNQAPEAEFKICAGKPVEVYEYCNLHGLWRAEGNKA
jgi:superoxide reductase